MIYYDLVRFKLPLQIFILIFQHNRQFYKYINFNDISMIWWDSKFYCKSLFKIFSITVRSTNTSTLMICYDLVKFKLPLQIFILIFQHNSPFYK